MVKAEQSHPQGDGRVPAQSGGGLSMKNPLASLFLILMPKQYDFFNAPVSFSKKNKKTNQTTKNRNHPSTVKVWMQAIEQNTYYCDSSALDEVALHSVVSQRKEWDTPTRPKELAFQPACWCKKLALIYSAKTDFQPVCTIGSVTQTSARQESVYVGHYGKLDDFCTEFKTEFGESYSDLILVPPVTKQVSSSCKQVTEQ